MGRNTLRRYEQGITYPSLENIKKLADILDTDVTELYDECILFILNLPSNIKHIKKQYNLTSIELAKQIGINNPRTISDWINNKHIPNTSIIKKLMQY